ncbi:transcriptional regulator [Erysipelothrix sp. HDW6C]|uniref:LCP family protein n=1 Tax=Erysipelothrix sp. HDW6C TaxID=2714930 RepID=UPI00140BFE67|nr:LCP family protein [Erysipelothrix sp. HDW6C]QIK70016.1 transcriptional regulator [Erysipelothrix sp. HDW6C]
MKKNKELFVFKGSFIFFIQAIITLFISVAIFRLDLLPFKFMGIVIGSLLVILMIFGFWLLKSKKGAFLNFGKILSLLLSLVLVIGTNYVLKGDSFIGSIAGANQDTHVVSVIVRNDSDYRVFDDVKGFDFGANTLMDRANIDKARSLFEGKTKNSISIDEFSQYESLANALIDGDIEVMFLSEAHRAVVAEVMPDFNESTRVIDSVKWSVESKVTDRNTDVSKDTYSIYISGIDTYGPVSSVARSDVNMIVTVNPLTKQILLTSIPRDYHVILPSFNAYDKLTHAGIYGVGESVSTLENLLGIDIDFYARVNFDSVEQIVDALGGVDIYSDIAFTAFDGREFVEGYNYVDGEAALSFARERYSIEGGDNARVKNQQALLTAVLKKAMSPAIITNYNSILGSVAGSFELSMPEGDFKQVIKNEIDDMSGFEILSIQLRGFGSSSDSTVSMPGWNLYVMEPDFDTVNRASELILQMEAGQRISVD